MLKINKPTWGDKLFQLAMMLLVVGAALFFMWWRFSTCLSEHPDVGWLYCI